MNQDYYKQNHHAAIKTGRYLYHIAYKYKRESIQKSGLLGRVNDRDLSNASRLVFAHNSEIVNYNWYWIFMDGYDNWVAWQMSEVVYETLQDSERMRLLVNDYYDIWRIDNEILNRDWYLDFIGLKDSHTDNINLYAYCRESVPKEAIKLCAMDIDRRMDFVIEDGINYRYFYNPIIPVEEFYKKHGFYPEEEISRKKEQFYKNMPHLDTRDLMDKRKVNRLRIK
jgi:hypothetical protein